MNKKGFELSYMGALILGLIALSIVIAAYVIFRNVGTGGLQEIFRNFFGAG